MDQIKMTWKANDIKRGLAVARGGIKAIIFQASSNRFPGDDIDEYIMAVPSEAVFMPSTMPAEAMAAFLNKNLFRKA